MGTSDFFRQTREQSRVKAAIVSKYFDAWANVMIAKTRSSTGTIAYVDMFAGPGNYSDGTKSKPVLVMEKALANPDMRNMLITIFNDDNEDYCESLRQTLANLPGIDTLRHQPDVMNEVVSEDTLRKLDRIRGVPTLFFVDPWGYKGVSLRLLDSLVRGWGCDCVFFFNYKRINAGLGNYDNQAIYEHMDALFGGERALDLRKRLESMDKYEREFAIVEEISQALREGGKYVLPFCFKSDSGRRTSHHLVFVSKHFKGYEIMKRIMAGESSLADQGVPSFQYCPADIRQPLLFQLTRPLDELEEALLTKFAGRRIAMHTVYEEHNVGTPYIERNYKEALIGMELSGKVLADPSHDRRRKGTFGPNVIVTFPRKGD